MMTGSGSSVFGLFDDYEKINSAKKEFDESGISSIIARPLI